MTKAANPDDPDQSERFKKTVRDLEKAGELSPTEAGEAFERAIGRVLPKRTKSRD